MASFLKEDDETIKTPITLPVVLQVLGRGDGDKSNTTSITNKEEDKEKESKPTNGNQCHATTTTIMLDPSEYDLIQTLLGTVHALERGDLTIVERPHVRTVNVRIAGGWVRDKLLGLSHTHDVDIALDTCSGVEFATLVQDYLQQQQQDQDQQKSSSVSNTTTTTTTTTTAATTTNTTKIGVIAANPNQSKHLETATTKIYGMDVDYSNLRSEAYSNPNSRIPTIVCGTPYQDAYRRDFTINALYYHIQQNTIEDWTREGISDLLGVQPIIKTPLAAYETFQDDPLRVLRAIRFAVRYNYPLSHDIQQAAQQLIIHTALHVKVSRERVGNELQGMMVGKSANPRKALTLINQLHLAGSVFLLPTTPEPLGPSDSTTTATTTTPSSILWNGTLGIRHPKIYPPPSPSGGGEDGMKEEDDVALAAKAREMAWNEGHDCLDLVPSLLACLYHQDSDPAAAVPATMSKSASSSSLSSPTVVNEALVYMASFLLPFYQLYYTDTTSKKSTKNKTKSVVEFMMREGIKHKNKDVQHMITIMENVSKMATFLKDNKPPVLPTDDDKDDDNDNDDSNITAAQWKQLRLQAGLLLRSTKELWVTTMVVAGVLCIRQDPSLVIHSATSSSSSSTSDQDTAAVASLIQKRVAQWHRALLLLPLSSSSSTPGGGDGGDGIGDGSSANTSNASTCFQLDHCWTVKPIFNGKEIATLLQLPKGPIVGIYTQKVVEWMLQYPGGTKDACIEYLKQEKQQEEEKTKQQQQQQILGSDTHTAAASNEGPVSKKMHLDE